MNYYPYFASLPYAAGRVGLFSRLFGGGLSFSSILSGTQKALNFANQAIPLVKQASPAISNAKTMFKLMSEFKKVNTPNTTVAKETVKDENLSSTPSNNSYSPTFFL